MKGIFEFCWRKFFCFFHVVALSHLFRSHYQCFTIATRVCRWTSFVHLPFAVKRVHCIRNDAKSLKAIHRVFESTEERRKSFEFDHAKNIANAFERGEIYFWRSDTDDDNNAKVITTNLIQRVLCSYHLQNDFVDFVVVPQKKRKSLAENFFSFAFYFYFLRFALQVFLVVSNACEIPLHLVSSLRVTETYENETHEIDWQLRCRGISCVDSRSSSSSMQFHFI